MTSVDQGSSLIVGNSTNRFRVPAYLKGDLIYPQYGAPSVHDRDDKGPSAPFISTLTSVTFSSADSSAPVVTLVSPAANSIIRSDTAVVIDVTDDSGGVPYVMISARFPNGDKEVVYDDEGFSPKYSSSTRTAIAGGWRFTIRRASGWPAAPSIHIIPIDGSGNEG